MLSIIIIIILLLTVAGLLAMLLRLKKEISNLKSSLVAVDSVPDAGPSDNKEEARNEASAERELILVASEDRHVLHELTEALSDSYEVVRAEDGNKVVQLAGESNPAIIIADMMLPGITGLELCRQVRGTIETSHIAVILFSSMYERENVIYALEAGADEFFTTPFDIEIMKVRLRNILNRSQLLREEVSTMSKEPDQIDYKSLLDKEFMDRVLKIIERQMDNADFTINEFCSELAMSRSSVYHKLKTLTGNGPNDVIRVVRLNRAKELLEQHRYNISEVSMMVGFSDPKYFSTCFKKQFGMSPSKV